MQHLCVVIMTMVGHYNKQQPSQLLSCDQTISSVFELVKVVPFATPPAKRSQAVAYAGLVLPIHTVVTVLHTMVTMLHAMVTV